ncbi:hypothetical protein DFH06DRAFT_991909 [Mycena polygramma]|nr:hypothetical protein DFH06DRAFT_991909 [Mycena polygramma]
MPAKTKSNKSNKSNKTSSSSAPSSSPSSASSSAPELTIFSRVAGIPLVACAINVVNDSLAKNRLTSYPYSTAKDLSVSAYQLSAPLQVRIAPLLTTGDLYANKGLDLVQSNFPSAFETKPEDITTFVHERRQSAVDFVAVRRSNANKAIDENVKKPAINVACEVDKRFAPFVDYLESTAATRLNTSTAPADTQYQYQRVFYLSKNVTEQAYAYSHQTALVQRASQSVDTITAMTSSANARIHALSDALICELQHLRTSLGEGAGAASHELGDTISALRDIVKTPNLSVNDKVVRISDECQFRARPVLARIQSEVETRARPILDRFPGATRSAPTTPTTNGNANGNGHVE